MDKHAWRGRADTFLAKKNVTDAWKCPSPRQQNRFIVTVKKTSAMGSVGPDD